MAPKPELRVEGLAELRKALTKMQAIDERTELRVGLKAAAQIVADDAKRRVPVRTGRARDSIRAAASGNRALVIGGKAKVPYYGWLDFGSRSPVAGNPRTVGPWRGSGTGPAKGRFIYPAIDAKFDEVVAAVSAAVEKALETEGLL
jgi:HK97 gp10 family phage protein